MPREKREVEELRQRAINSLVLAIELFNRPHDDGRTEGTLILLHHAFEMLLKSIIVREAGTVFGKDKRCSYGFEKCLNIAQNELKVLTRDDKLTLSTLDNHRDVAMHYYAELSEDMLYLQCQASVTLFDGLLNSVYHMRLADFMPERVLPISVRPPKDIQLLLASELARVDELLSAGSRKGHQAAARLRAIMAFATASRENVERVTEKELKRAIKSRRAGNNWDVIFPEIGQLRLNTEGEGIALSMRISKEGIPMRFAKEGEETLLVKREDWFDKYNLTYTKLAEKLGMQNKTNKLRAYMYEIELWKDPELFGLKHLGSQEVKRYTKKAIDALKLAIEKYPEAEIWAKHKSKIVGRRKKHK